MYLDCFQCITLEEFFSVLSLSLSLSLSLCFFLLKASAIEFVDLREVFRIDDIE